MAEFKKRPIELAKEVGITNEEASHVMQTLFPKAQPARIGGIVTWVGQSQQLKSRSLQLI